MGKAKEVEVKEEVKLLTPTEASKVHHELFSELEAKFRNLHEDMTKGLGHIESKKKEIEESVAGISDMEKNVKNQSILADNKNKEAQHLLDLAKTKMEEAESEEVRLNGIRVTLEATDKALAKQREEVQESLKDIANRIKQVEIDERAVAYERKQVERLIKDNKIKAELAK